MNAHTGKIRTLFVLALLACLVVVAGYVGIFWTIKTKGEHISTLANDIVAEGKREEVLKSLKNVGAETAALRGKLDAYFISPDGVVSFLGFVDGLGRTSGVALEITNLGLEDVAGSPLPSEFLRLQIVAGGSWNSVYHFLSLLDSLPYKTRFEDASIQKTPKERMVPTVDAEGKPKPPPPPWVGTFRISVLKLK